MQSRLRERQPPLGPPSAAFHVPSRGVAAKPRRLFTTAAERQHNVIARPRSAGAALIQLDDLDEDATKRLRPVSFLILRTSPGNYQAWVAVADGNADFTRRLRKGAGADLAASGATRVSGSPELQGEVRARFPMRRDAPFQSRPGCDAGRSRSPRHGRSPRDNRPGGDPHFTPAPQCQRMAELSALRGQRAAGTRWGPTRHQPSGFHLLPAGDRLKMGRRRDRRPAVARKR